MRGWMGGCVPDYIEKSSKFGGYEVVDGYNTTFWNSSMLSWFTVDTQIPVQSAKHGLKNVDATCNMYCIRFSNPYYWINGTRHGGPLVYALHYDVNSFRKVASDPALFVLPPMCKRESKCVNHGVPPSAPVRPAFKAEVTQDVYPQWGVWK